MQDQTPWQGKWAIWTVIRVAIIAGWIGIGAFVPYSEGQEAQPSLPPLTPYHIVRASNAPVLLKVTPEGIQPWHVDRLTPVRLEFMLRNLGPQVVETVTLYGAVYGPQGHYKSGFIVRFSADLRSGEERHFRYISQFPCGDVKSICVGPGDIVFITVHSVKAGNQVWKVNVEPLITLPVSKLDSTVLEGNVSIIPILPKSIIPTLPNQCNEFCNECWVDAQAACPCTDAKPRDFRSISCRCPIDGGGTYDCSWSCVNCAP